MIKTRIHPQNNYKGIWVNGKTIRIALDPTKDIQELDYPEFYDVKFTGACQGACSFCYQDSKESDNHFKDIVGKINSYFGSMSENERPFQVAIGGGEPTLHPDFAKGIKAFQDLGIMPNYTTNGMHMTDEVIEVTKECGGVALSCHPHLREYWEESAKKLSKLDVELNFHIIISDKESVDYFTEIYEKWHDKIDYFVLLPYGVQGRAKHKDIDWEYLVQSLPENQDQIAFGANFYPYLTKGGHGIKVSLYEPESMSRYLDLEGTGSLYPSSFSNIALKRDLFKEVA